VSGDQHELAFGDYRACVASVGGGLRTFRCRDRDLVVPYAAGEERPAMRGALLAPWPNRTRDGRYEFGGATHRLAVNEPERVTALHGLVADLDFRATAHDAARVALAGMIEPRPGYPWRVALEVVYTLGATGLTHAVTATNLSADVAPVGIGVHPYVLAGPERPHAVDDWLLEMPAATVMLVTPDRLLPERIVPVHTHDGGSLDYREPRRIGGARLNHAYTGLRRDADGVARIRVTDAAGRGVELGLDRAYRWAHVYTSDEVADGRPRSGLAVEPTTCPPDALNSGVDLWALRPGESARATWTMRALDA